MARENDSPVARVLRSPIWRQREGILIAAIVLAAVIFGLTNETFLQFANLKNIVVQSSMILLVGFGMSVVIIAGGIDLSVGSVAAVAGVATVWLLENGVVPPSVALLAGVGLGALVGLANGLVVTRLGVPGIIATLGTMTLLRGVAFLIAGGFSVRSEDAQLAFVANGNIAGVPTPIVIVLVVFVLVHWLLAYTSPGRAFYAVGGNLQAARLAGMNVQGTVVASYVVAATLAAVAGMIAASRTASGSPIAGAGWELQAVMIVILGGASLFGGSGRVVGTLLAGLLIGMINNWISLQGISAVQNIVTGTLLIAIVAVSERRLRQPKALVARLIRSQS